MSRVWFTSDLHLGHDKVRGYCDRPFSNVDEMDDVLIQRYNSCVGAEDVAYIMGDVTLGVDAMKYLRRLNGMKLIVPSLDHDKRWVDGLAGKDTQNVVVLPPLHFVRYPRFAVEGRGLWVTLCHYEMASWPASHYNQGGKGKYSGSPGLRGHQHGGKKIVSVQLHGHHHGNHLPTRLGQLDVSVDAWDGYPVSLEDVVKLVNDGIAKYPGWTRE